MLGVLPQALTALHSLEHLGIAADTPTRIGDFSALTALKSLRQLLVFATFMYDGTDEEYVQTVRSEFGPIAQMTCVSSFHYSLSFLSVTVAQMTRFTKSTCRPCAPSSVSSCR